MRDDSFLSLQPWLITTECASSDYSILLSLIAIPLSDNCYLANRLYIGCADGLRGISGWRFRPEFLTSRSVMGTRTDTAPVHTTFLDLPVPGAASSIWILHALQKRNHAQFSNRISGTSVAAQESGGDIASFGRNYTYIETSEKR